MEVAASIRATIIQYFHAGVLKAAYLDGRVMCVQYNSSFQEKPQVIFKIGASINFGFSCINCFLKLVVLKLVVLFLFSQKSCKGYVLTLKYLQNNQHYRIPN